MILTMFCLWSSCREWPCGRAAAGEWESPCAHPGAELPAIAWPPRRSFPVFRCVRCSSRLVVSQRISPRLFFCVLRGLFFTGFLAVFLIFLIPGFVSVLRFFSILGVLLITGLFSVLRVFGILGLLAVLGILSVFRIFPILLLFVVFLFLVFFIRIVLLVLFLLLLIFKLFEFFLNE